MQLSSNLSPNSDFTKIMNEVIFDSRLTHAEFRVWCQLLALPKGAQEVAVEADAIADQLGIAASVFRKHRQALKDKGFLVGDRNSLVVTVPSEDFKPKEAKLTKEQQLRADLRDTWMASRPEIYSKLKHPLSAAQAETLRLHAEHNGETDLCRFLGAVLSGCKADNWWNSHGMNFNNIFGTGTPKQNKFTNVEKLYKLSSSKAGRAALFDVNDDQCWIDWFHSEGHDSFTEVKRMAVADRFEGWDHEVANPSNSAIQVYCDSTGKVVHWTYKQIPSNFVTQLPAS